MAKEGGEPPVKSAAVHRPAYGIPDQTLLSAVCLLLFAALNIINVAFILSVAGVNVAWILALYSYRTFAPAKRTRTAAAPVT